MRTCWCGCGAATRGRFAPGHDARYKSILRDRHHSGATFLHPAAGYNGVAPDEQVTAMELAEEMGEFWVNMLNATPISDAAVREARGHQRAANLMARLEASGKALHQMGGGR